MILLASIAGSRLFAQVIGGGTCDNSTLNTTYAVTFGNRVVTNGTFGTVYQQLGTAVFDGKGNATFKTTVNSNSAAGTSLSLQATYTLGADCTGTISTGSLVFNLVVFSNGTGFTMTGNSGSQVVTGGGTLLASNCSGGSQPHEFIFTANGYVLNGTTVTDIADLSGVFQTDGMGNLTATWTVVNGEASTTVNTSGQYSVQNNCQGSATLMDSTNLVTYSFSLETVGNGSNFNFIASSPTLIFSGTGHFIQ